MDILLLIIGFMLGVLCGWALKAKIEKANKEAEEQDRGFYRAIREIQDINKN